MHPFPSYIACTTGHYYPVFRFRRIIISFVGDSCRCNRGRRNKPGLLLPFRASHPFSNFVDSRMVAVSIIILQHVMMEKAASIVVTKNRARGRAIHPLVINHTLSPHRSLIPLFNLALLFFQLSNSRFRLAFSSVNLLRRRNCVRFGSIRVECI